MGVETGCALRAVQQAMEGWAEFTREVQQYYGVDMACLGDQFRREQKGDGPSSLQGLQQVAHPAS